MILEKLVVGSLEVNCYILADDGAQEAMIIDPGSDIKKIKRFLERQNLKPAMVINTHGHIDHIGCDDEFGVPVYIHRLDAPLLRSADMNLSNFLMSAYSVKSEIKTLEDKEKLALGKIELEVIHTPGHTPGGICLLMQCPKEKILFSGDSLFFRSIGRTDFPGASEAQLIDSVKEKLFCLSDDTIVYPGHGPLTSIGQEKKENPFLRNA